MSDPFLIEAAINNLEFLKEKNKFLGNNYKLVNNQFVPSDDDAYDTIYAVSELEYPIYFTFHQVINHVHASYGGEISGYTRYELLDLMSESISNIYEYYLGIDERNGQFERIVDDIDAKVDYIHGYYKYGVFMFLPTKIKEYVNSICKTIISFSEGYTDYYGRRNHSYEEDSDNSLDDSDNESNSVDDSDNESNSVDDTGDDDSVDDSVDESDDNKED